MEGLLSGELDKVLVGANTGGLKGLGAQLLILVGDEVDAEREVVNVGLLATKIEDSDLGVGDTTVEPGLGIRLEFTMSAIRQFVILVFPRKPRHRGLGRAATAERNRIFGMTAGLPTTVSPRAKPQDAVISVLRNPATGCGGPGNPTIFGPYSPWSKNVCSPCSCSIGSNGRGDGPS